MFRGIFRSIHFNVSSLSTGHCIQPTAENRPLTFPNISSYGAKVQRQVEDSSVSLSVCAVAVMSMSGEVLNKDEL